MAKPGQVDGVGGGKVFALPAKTRVAVEEYLAERRRLEGLVNSILATAAECLGVPEGYVVRSLDVGFEPGEVAGRTGVVGMHEGEFGLE